MLITRCPSCRTAFKVVPDQLRLGQGWVKCGKCTLAFNAEKHFVAVPQPAATVATAAVAMLAKPEMFHDSKLDAPAPAPLLTLAKPEPAEPDAFDDDKLSPQTLFPSDALDAIDELVAMGAMRAAGSSAFGPPTAGAMSKPGFMESHTLEHSTLNEPCTNAPQVHATKAGAPSQDREADASTSWKAAPDFNRESASGSLDEWRKRKADRKTRRPQARLGGADATEATAQPPWHPQSTALKAEEDILPHEAEPSFVAQAKSRERWQSGPARMSLLILLTVGCMVLITQLSYLNRHWLAVAQPGTLPFLSSLCSAVKSTTDAPCDIEPLKRIEALRVDSHSLAPNTAANAPPNSYVLSVTLKNQLDLANTWPALDIVFTDTTGAVQARRVLQARDYLDAARSSQQAKGLAAREEQRVSVRFEAPSLRVGGYEITAFYP